MDSGSFINSGFDRTLLNHSTSFYGLFIAHISWGKSIWLVILGQSLLLSVTLALCFKYFFHERNRAVLYVSYVSIITLLLPASLITSTISPGIFSSITILILGVFYCADGLSKRDLYLIAFILIACSFVDFINILFILLFSCCYKLKFVLRKRKIIGGFRSFKFKRSGVLSCIALLTLISIFFSRRISQSKSEADLEIITAKFCYFRNTGILLDYPNQTHVSKLLVPAILHKGGTHFYDFSSIGVDPNSTKKIVSQIQIEKALNWRILIRTIQNFYTRLTNFGIESYEKPDVNSESFDSIYHWYNWESRECMISRQFQNWLWLDYLNYSQMIVILSIAIGFACLVFLRTKKDVTLTSYSIVAIIVYCFISAAIYGGDKKPDSQIIWILSLPFFGHLCKTRLGRLGLANGQKSSVSQSKEV
ncbi:hypothetical protein [Mucilaginibacter oryzae]|uniref:hypothetical protein n=1 Tax=Mucilaginibacter oryzae TaxID=468058 RepID=UPI00147339C3|nr:hypothetical protein [Mucilaginibacter oryzae]